MLSARDHSTVPADDVTAINAVLTCVLTGVNQYFLHARMLKHKGFMKLADTEYKKSLDTMKYTDQLVNLLLVQNAVPNMQDLGRLRIGETVPQILKNDLALAEDTKTAIAAAGSDHAALSSLLTAEEERIAFIQSELKLIDSMGLNAYLQSQA
jgi:bacterioferritin